MKIAKLATIFSFTILLVLSACSEGYLTTEPTNVATSDQIGEMAREYPDKFIDLVIQPLLNGVYNYMNQYNTQNSSSTVHNDFGWMSIMHLGDVMTDDLAFHAQGSGWYTYDYMFDYRAEQYVRPFYYWNFFYSLINKSNDIINKIPTDIEDARIEVIKGQALALRGISYYYLICMFQQPYTQLSDPATTPGVPIIYTTAEGESRLNRVPVAEVYAQSEKDLLDAITLLEGFDRKGVRTVINKQVAQMLLSRVYLSLERWSDAEKMAHDARVASDAQLMTTAEVARDGFNNINGKEWMWGADITAETTTMFASFFSFICTFDAGYGGAVGQYRKIDARLYEKFSPTDARLAQFKSPDAEVNANSADVTVKCPAYTNFKFKAVAGWEADYVFMRISEAYLTEAEAMARQGNESGAATLMKEFMANRDPAWSKSSITADEVYQQRRLELWGEGFSFFDHLRLKKDIIRVYEGSNHWAGGRMDVNAGDWILIYQIPLREIQNNDEITEEDQNP
jgi:hypothetical protein